MQTDQVAPEDAIETMDRTEQTEAIGQQIASTQVDVPELSRHFGYRQEVINLSGFERIMRHLSQKQHIRQLQAWLQPETARTNVRLILSPSFPYASKIILAAYDSNQHSCTFVAEADGNFVVEIWSLRNLLSPIKARKLPLDNEPHSLKILNNNVAIASEHIILLSTNRIDDDDFTEIRSAKRAIVALEYMRGKLHCLTEDRLLLRVNKTPPHFSAPLATSPLFHASRALAVTHRRTKVAEVLSDSTIVWFTQDDSRNYETIRVDSDCSFNTKTAIEIVEHWFEALHQDMLVGCNCSQSEIFYPYSNVCGVSRIPRMKLLENQYIKV